MPRNYLRKFAKCEIIMRINKTVYRMKMQLVYEQLLAKGGKGENYEKI